MRFPALADLARGIQGALPQLQAEIRFCIQVCVCGRSVRACMHASAEGSWVRIPAARPLRVLIRSLNTPPPHTHKVENGRLLDSSSPELAEVRAARSTNLAALRREMDAWARRLHAAGVSERAQVVVRRDRLCVPVRQGRQGELPRGSVALATSASGSTIYMEPQPAVALNNAEMALAGRERVGQEKGAQG